MRRIDPFKLKRKPAPELTRSFTDPGVEGEELVLTIRRLDMAQQMAAMDAVEDQAARYIDGEDGGPPIPVIVDGALVELSRALLLQCVFLERMQTAPVGERYGVLDWVALSVTMPAAYEAAAKWATKLQKGTVDASGPLEALPPSSTEDAAASS